MQTKLRALITAFAHWLMSKLDSSSHYNQTAVRSSGSCGLPVEIWEYTFSLACIQETELEFPRITEVLPTVPGDVFNFTYFSPYNKEHQDRLSFSMVCHYWHDIMQPILWKHLYLRIKHTSDGVWLSSLIKTLEEEPRLARSVSRLTVIPRSHPHQNDDWTIDDVQRIVSLLPNLSICQCRLDLRQISSPGVPIDYFYDYCNRYCSLPPYSTESPRWINCTTLLLSARIKPSSFTELTFPNLMDLKIETSGLKTIEWISKYWNMPRLRSLSIRTSRPDQWLPTLRKLNQLESLDMDSHSLFAVSASPLELQNLHTITSHGSLLSRPYSYSIDWVLVRIVTSQLRHLVFHLSDGYEPEMGQYPQIGEEYYERMEKKLEEKVKWLLDRALAICKMVKRMTFILRGFRLREEKHLVACFREWRRHGITIEIRKWNGERMIFPGKTPELK